MWTVIQHSSQENAPCSLRPLERGLKGRSAFPNDESIMKVLYMGLQHVAKKWTQPIPEWKAALNQFVILFGERVQV